MSSLKKYRKLKYLGKGSYGAAILVELRSNPKEKFVVKEIVIGHLTPQEQTNAKNEAEVLNQLSHSNITMYIESFVESSKLYIVMEYADGGDLSGAIKQQKASGKRWKEEDIMRIFVQICLALKHVHDANILHRDLKSQNIFLTAQGIVKLGDFGIAKALDATDDQAKTQIGTPYYLSPEICESQPYGRASDVWSLGVVLFELTALELPFLAPSLPMLVQQICYAEPRFAATKVETFYSKTLVTLMRRVLQKSPKDRPTVKEILKTDIVKAHISRLLSHTIKAGNAAGGDDGVAAAAREAYNAKERLSNPSDNASVSSNATNKSDETDAKKKWLVREAEMKKEIAEINSNSGRESSSRDSRKDDREKLRRFREDMKKKDESSTKSQGYDGITADAKPRSSSVEAYRHHANQYFHQHFNKHNSVDNSIDPQVVNQQKIVRRQGPMPLSEYHRQGPSTASSNSSCGKEYESFARQEYFASRAAAAAVKAKIEMNERDSVRISSSIAYDSHDSYSKESGDEYDAEMRVAAVKAHREREKQQEIEEKQRQLEQAAVIYRQQRKQLEAKKAGAVAFDVSFDDDTSSSSKSEAKSSNRPVSTAVSQSNSRSSSRSQDHGISEIPPNRVMQARAQFDRNRIETKDQPSNPSSNIASPLSKQSSDSSRSGNSSAPRQRWSRPGTGEEIVVAPVGVISLSPQSIKSSASTEVTASDDGDLKVLKRMRSRNLERVNARQQAKDILRKLRDQKQSESKQSNEKRHSPMSAVTTSSSASSDQSRGSSRISGTKMNEVMSNIQKAQESVDKAVSMAGSGHGRHPSASRRKHSPDDQTTNETVESNDVRGSGRDLGVIDEGAEEGLEETLSLWLVRQRESYRHKKGHSNEPFTYISVGRHDDHIDDTTTVAVDDSSVKYSSHSDKRKQGLSDMSIAAEVDEEEILLGHDISMDDVASLQCELAKALMIHDDDD